ncbi:MAG: hypothetical protein IPI85_11660 [Dehalococcoidia bacterium]|nr:hypothetical protein [Dehalococcoidia bacterium]
MGTEKDVLEDVDIEGNGTEAEETELAARLEESDKRDVGSESGEVERFRELTLDAFRFDPPGRAALDGGGGGVF